MHDCKLSIVCKFGMMERYFPQTFCVHIILMHDYLPTGCFGGSNATPCYWIPSQITPLISTHIIYMNDSLQNQLSIPIWTFQNWKNDDDLAWQIAGTSFLCCTKIKKNIDFHLGVFMISFWCISASDMINAMSWVMLESWLRYCYKFTLLCWRHTEIRQ